VTDYLNSARVAAASRSLVDTDRAIADIAHECGFTNLANFNRQFRRSRGMTPREYRRAFEAPVPDSQ
jgi:transcriptional regulator GlxA family with amidase domain